MRWCVTKALQRFSFSPLCFHHDFKLDLSTEKTIQHINFSSRHSHLRPLQLIILHFWIVFFYQSINISSKAKHNLGVAMEDAQRWTAMYTKHVKQKRKVYQDGFLELPSSGNKVFPLFLLFFRIFNLWTCSNFDVSNSRGCTVHLWVIDRYFAVFYMDLGKGDVNFCSLYISTLSYSVFAALKQKLGRRCWNFGKFYTELLKCDLCVHRIYSSL